MPAHAAILLAATVTLCPAAQGPPLHPHPLGACPDARTLPTGQGPLGPWVGLVQTLACAAWPPSRTAGAQPCRTIRPAGGAPFHPAVQLGQLVCSGLSLRPGQGSELRAQPMNQGWGSSQVDDSADSPPAVPGCGGADGSPRFLSRANHLQFLTLIPAPLESLPKGRARAPSPSCVPTDIRIAHSY